MTLTDTSTRTTPRTVSGHVPPTPPAPSPTGMALTVLLGQLELERRTLAGLQTTESGDR